ncbi:MAG TPA: hypothetical protein DC017_13870 [Candidatus Wallbacteria bacterium]|nr:hypothetical protein [Candidatus Wallbacteria bacterium]
MKLKPRDKNKNDFKIFDDIRKLIEETRQNLSIAVNAGLTMMYWKIGHRIGLEVLKGRRAEYGAEIVASLSRQSFLSSRIEKTCRYRIETRRIQAGAQRPDGTVPALS